MPWPAATYAPMALLCVLGYLMDYLIGYSYITHHYLITTKRKLLLASNIPSLTLDTGSIYKSWPPSDPINFAELHDAANIHYNFTGILADFTIH